MITNFRELRESIEPPPEAARNVWVDRMHYATAMALIQIAQELNEIKQVIVARNTQEKEGSKLNLDGMALIDIELDRRSLNTLYRANIRTVGELICHSEDELISIPNMGKIQLTIIKEALAVRGLKLRDS